MSKPVGKLTERQRRIWVAKTKWGATDREVAAFMDIHPGTVNRLYHAALHNIAELKRMAAEIGGDPADVERYLHKTILDE